MENSLKLSRFVLALCLLSFCSCFLIGKDVENHPLKNTISQVVVQYLQYSFLARTEAIESLIIPKEFLKNQELSRDEYDYRLVSLSRHWSADKNPLINIGLVSVSIDEDQASAVMKRRDGEFPELKFNLVWTGSSWAMIDDNIFGKGEIYEKATQ